MDVISQTTNAHLFIMASLSPKVAESIDQELYRLNAEMDESTSNHIVENAFYNLIKDLETIGLSFDIDPSDYIEDPQELSLFLQCAELLLPNGLYPLLKTESSIRALLQEILTGSIGDGSPIVQVFLSEIAALDGGIPHRVHLVEAIDRLYTRVSQTGVFTDYLRNIMSILDQEKEATDIDPERHQLYNQKMRLFIGAMSDAVNLFEHDVDYQRLVQIQNIVIKDLLSPDNFIDYAYLFLESPQTLPEELISGWFDKWTQYSVSHKWCWFYYPARQITQVERPFLMMSACFTYANSNTLELYKENVVAMRIAYPDDYVDQQISALYMLKD